MALLPLSALAALQGATANSITEASGVILLPHTEFLFLKQSRDVISIFSLSCYACFWQTRRWGSRKWCTDRAVSFDRNCRQLDSRRVRWGQVGFDLLWATRWRGEWQRSTAWCEGALPCERGWHISASASTLALEHRKPSKIKSNNSSCWNHYYSLQDQTHPLSPFSISISNKPGHFHWSFGR